MILVKNLETTENFDAKTASNSEYNSGYLLLHLYFWVLNRRGRLNILGFRTFARNCFRTLSALVSCPVVMPRRYTSSLYLVVIRRRYTSSLCLVVIPYRFAILSFGSVKSIK